MYQIFITGIGTDVGKTIVSAIFCEALNADYWKPIQTGAEENPDVEAVKQLISNHTSVFHPSSVNLQLPASPNIAAKAENTNINLASISFPKSSNTLVVEGAGGLMVPINETQTYADFIIQHRLPVILVVRDYLGCINHTLLSYAFLKEKGILVVAGVFNGDFSAGVKETIQQHTDLKWIEIGAAQTLNVEFIRAEANKIRPFIAELAEARIA